MKEWQRDILWLLLWISGIAFLIWFIYQIRSVIILFLITGLLAYILNPSITKLAHKLKLKKGLVVGIFYIIIITPIILLLVLVLPILGNQILSLVKNLPKYYDLVMNMIEQLQNTLQTSPMLQDAINSFLSTLRPQVENFLSSIGLRVLNLVISITSSIFTLILAIILNFYFLIDIDNIKRSFINILPLNIRDKTLKVLEEINKSFKAFLKAQGILCLFVGLADGLGVWILGIDYALTLGLIAGFTEVIPYLGPYIGAIPAIIVALTISPWKALEIAIWYIAVQQIENHFIVPNVMGKAMGLHPLTVIFSLLVFGKLLGFWGVLLAVPIAAIIKIVLKVYFIDIWKKED